jgi:hypothetical protein
MAANFNGPQSFVANRTPNRLDVDTPFLGNFACQQEVVCPCNFWYFCHAQVDYLAPPEQI